MLSAFAASDCESVDIRSDAVEYGDGDMEDDDDDEKGVERRR